MEIQISSKDEFTVVTLQGKLDTLTSPLVQSELERIQQEIPRSLALDFTHVDYVSSAGLRVVLMAQKRAKASGNEVVLIGLKDSIFTVFKISGFTTLFRFTQTMEEV